MTPVAYIDVPTIVTMLIALGIPALVAFVTREALAPWAKALILILLSALSGVLTSIVANLPTTARGWEQVAFNVLITFALAVAADHGWYKPSGTAAAIHRQTEPFGLGPRTPPQAPPPPLQAPSPAA